MRPRSDSIIPGTPLPSWVLRAPLLDARERDGALSMWQPLPHLVVSRASGTLTESLAMQWVTAVRPLWSRPVQWVYFSDWEQLQGYDSRARALLTRLVLDERGKVRSAHFLTASKLVAMGVATAGAATALAGVSMTATTQRDEWLRMLAKQNTAG